MQVIILAAGYGTRLYPLTLKTAKPLLLIHQKPIINLLMDKINILKKYFDIKEVTIVVNNKFYRSFLGWKKKYRIKAKLINDGSSSPQDRLGAVKDLKLAISRKKCDCLVLGGDNLFSDDLRGFVNFALGNSPFASVGLYDVKDKKAAQRFGIATLNLKNRIIKFTEKPKNPSSTLAACCIYFFPRQSLRWLDAFINTNHSLDASGSYIAWLGAKSKVFGYTLEGEWVDIGEKSSFKKAEKFFGN